MKSIDCSAALFSLSRTLLTKVMLTFVAINMAACASNVSSITPSQITTSRGLQHPGNPAMPTSVHVQQYKSPHAQEISPGPPEGDTNDECTTNAQWPCVIQNKSDSDEAIVFPTVANGATITYTAPPVTSGVTYTPMTFTTTAPPYAYNYTLTATSTAPVGNNFSATIQTTITGSADYCKSNYCGSDPVVSYFQVSCALSLNHCPQLQIKDINFNKVVSGSPPPVTKTVVGYQASLTTAWAPNTGSGSYGTPSNVQWTVPGTTIKTYKKDGTSPVMLGSSDLQGVNVPFYWIAGGMEAPLVSGKLTRSDNGEVADVKASANYNVQVPTNSVSLKTPSTPGIYVGTRSDATGQFLTWGDQSNPAINFAFDVSNDDGFPGMIAMTQLINRSYTQNGTTVKPTSGQLWLDNDVNYANISETTGTALNAIDAPGLGLSNTFTTETITDSFSDYFMYMPKNHGIWVTLATASWGWNAGATIVNVKANQWCLDGVGSCPTKTPQASHSNNPPASASSALPIWPGTFHNGPAVVRGFTLGNQQLWHITPLSFPSL